MIDYALLVGLAVFYIINLALGLYQGRNIRTAHTYVFGESYSTGTLLLTLAGTFVGADYLTAWLRTGSHEGGGFALIFFISVSISILVATYYLFPNLRAFKNWYTLGDIARQAYDSRYVQVVVDSISLVSSIILLSAQLVALKRVSILLGINKDHTFAPYLLIISFTLVIIAYASRAGTPGVVSTDVLQMLLILGGTAFLAYKVLYLNLEDIHIHGVQDLWNKVKLQSDKSTLKYFLTENPSLRRSILETIGAGLILFSPAFIKRVGMASDNRQLKRSMIGFIMVYSLFMLTILICKLGLFLVHGGIVNFDDVYPSWLKILSGTLWVKLLLLIMFMAAVMSTADSILTAASLCAVRMMMVWQAKDLQVDEPNLNKLRLANGLVGCLSLALAVLFVHQPVVNFIVFGRSILGALLPCIVGISLGIKHSSKALLGSMACFGVLFIGSMIVGEMANFSFLEPKWSDLVLRRKLKVLLPFVILLSVLAYVLFEAMVHGGLKWESRERFTKS